MFPTSVSGKWAKEGQNGKVRGLGIGLFMGVGRVAGNQGGSGHSGAEAINNIDSKEGGDLNAVREQVKRT